MWWGRSARAATCSGRDRLLPLLGAGDLVAITGAGAYGAVMASHYNSRPSAAEVLVDGGRHAVIKASADARQQFADERIPDWLHGRSGADDRDRTGRRADDEQRPAPHAQLPPSPAPGALGGRASSGLWPALWPTLAVARRVRRAVAVRPVARPAAGRCMCRCCWHSLAPSRCTLWHARGRRLRSSAATPALLGWSRTAAPRTSPCARSTTRCRGTSPTRRPSGSGRCIASG